MYKIFENRKAQGISLNTIIIAAIALLVLVVLSFLLLSRTNNFAETVADCKSANGEVVMESECNQEEGEKALPQYDVDDPDTAVTEVCCITIG